MSEKMQDNFEPNEQSPAEKGGAPEDLPVTNDIKSELSEEQEREETSTEAEEPAAEAEEKSPSEKVRRDEEEAMASEGPSEETGLITTEKTQKERIRKEHLREKVEQQRAEKYGIDRSSGAWQIAKKSVEMALNTAGSITGTRIGWELPKFAMDYFRKKKQCSALDKATMDLLAEARASLKVKYDEKVIAAKRFEKLSEEEKNIFMTKLRSWDEELLLKNLERVRKTLAETNEYPQFTEDEKRQHMNAVNEVEQACRYIADKLGINMETAHSVHEEIVLYGIQGLNTWQEKTKEEINALKEEKEGQPGGLREKIKGLEARLKEAKMVPDEKKSLRTELAHILKEYRHKEKELGNMQKEQLGEVLGSYLNNKAQALVVGREAVNTLSIAVAAPGLRAVGYSAFAVFERARKAVEVYDREHLRAGDATTTGKWSAAYQSMKNAFGETWHSLKPLATDERGAAQRGMELVSSLGIVLRAAGLAEYEVAMQTGNMTPQEGFEKLREAVTEGRISDVFAQGWENWKGNLERLAAYVGYRPGEEEVKAIPVEEKGAYETLTEMRKEELAAHTAQQEAYAHGLMQEHLGGAINVHDVFGADTPLAQEIEHMGISQEELAFVGKIRELGVTPDDFVNIKSVAELSDLMDKVHHAELGANGPEVARAIFAQPEFAEKLDNPVVAALLKNESLSGDRVEEILQSDKFATIPKGGSVSEALGMRMAPDAKITVINPDGSVIEKFDANLVHPGDTVMHNAEGTITVFKTSEVSVHENQSLAGVYETIRNDLNAKGIPEQVQQAMNRGDGYWTGQISRAEAKAVTGL